jgi:hypothetical protein
MRSYEETILDRSSKNRLAMRSDPDFSGVWKVNTEKSKGIPAQGAYLAVITQKDGKLIQTNGITTQRGEQRSAYTWDLSGKETRGTLGGLPIESTAKYEGGALVVNAK